MDFKTSQKLYSKARMGKYLNACAGDKRKTMQLYRYNLRLCQRFYGTLNLFEVMLRNAINEHYAACYSDTNWIINQADTGKLLADDKDLYHRGLALLIGGPTDRWYNKNNRADVWSVLFFFVPLRPN